MRQVVRQYKDSRPAVQRLRIRQPERQLLRLRQMVRKHEDPRRSVQQLRIWQPEGQLLQMRQMGAVR